METVLYFSVRLFVFVDRLDIFEFEKRLELIWTDTWLVSVTFVLGNICWDTFKYFEYLGYI